MIYLYLYMSLCNRDLELIGSFRPVIPVMNEIYYIGRALKQLVIYMDPKNLMVRRRPYLTLR
jgi:hypothetical protein